MNQSNITHPTLRVSFAFLSVMLGLQRCCATVYIASLAPLETCWQLTFAG